MRLKKPLLLAPLAMLTLLLSATLWATETRYPVKLDKVTVFFQGAELQGHAQVTLVKGENELILTGVANQINPQSLTFNLGEQVTLLSTTVKSDYFPQVADSDTVRDLLAKVSKLKQQRDALLIELQVSKEEVTLLKGNRIDALMKNDSSLTNARQIIDFVKQNLTAAYARQQELQSTQQALDKQISQFEAQLNEERGQQTTNGSAIVLKVLTEQALTMPLNITYLTPQAGWTPSYDVRVQEIDKPLELTYKANVYQQSGLDWQQVKFILSTANPSAGIVAPQPTPWYVFVDGGKNKFMSDSKAMMMDGVMSEQVSMAPAAKASANYVSIQTNGIHQQFEITLPYTIKGNSQNNILRLQHKQVNAEYRYIATPKLDPHVYLQAQISDWPQLSLLPGQSSVFFAGSYIGEDYITTAGVSDKLAISLGRDPAILITRDQTLNDTSKPSLFGNEISQKFAYTINVNNSKTWPISLSVFDQLPVIQNQLLTLTDAQYDGASYDKESGLLTWQLSLAANESKQLPFSFKVNYPKDQRQSIIGL